MKTLRRIPALFACLCALLVTAAGIAVADYEDTLAAVKRSIEADSTLGAHDIQIIHRQDGVILKGTVATKREKDRMIEIAKNTKDVNKVTDWLVVRGAGTAPVTQEVAANSVSDDQIEADIRRALAADQRMLADKITVSVNRGNAVLGGDVGNYKEADQVLSTALMVNGVRDISSNITINGRAYETLTFTR